LRLSPLKRRELIRKLRALGFEGPFAGGRHEYVERAAQRIRVPNPHASRDVGVPILKLIIRQVGVSEEEWHDL